MTTWRRSPVRNAATKMPVTRRLAPTANTTRGMGLPRPASRPVVKPVPPAEVSAWVIEKTAPEMIEHLRQTFNEGEFLAGVWEIEETGGLKFEDFIGEIEEIVDQLKRES